MVCLTIFAPESMQFHGFRIKARFLIIYLTLREEHRLRVLERIFGHKRDVIKGWRKST
jgi:hypothetical protein